MFSGFVGFLVFDGFGGELTREGPEMKTSEKVERAWGICGNCCSPQVGDLDHLRPVFSLNGKGCFHDTERLDGWGIGVTARWVVVLGGMARFATIEAEAVNESVLVLLGGKSAEVGLIAVAASFGGKVGVISQGRRAEEVGVNLHSVWVTRVRGDLRLGCGPEGERGTESALGSPTFRLAFTDTGLDLASLGDHAGEFVGFAFDDKYILDFLLETMVESLGLGVVVHGKVCHEGLVCGSVGCDVVGLAELLELHASRKVRVGVCPAVDKLLAKHVVV